ncbi:DUF805 domain-containing protein [Cypionkella sp.]|uniref:DUF805 domain-containing protein n=1 Tax=Cypionkella sp. TaxID=2811411 RepID=UPI002637C664|nr:DUF805 domain-containing protein [Cypionkella sp.]MDB5663834.1 hypothetical protein [Cypionkella sp.]
MNFVEAVKSAYANYANFSGRSQRSAYWWFTLFNVAVGLVIALLEGGGSYSAGGGSMQFAVVGGLFSTIWMLVNLLPGLALAVRRLHDVDKSGWWLFIALIPLVGAIILLVWFCTRGTVGSNRFSADPLGANASVF